MIARFLNASLQDVAHIQFARDLLVTERLSLVGLGSVASDHETAGDAREVSGQVLGKAVSEILLTGIAAEICEGQNDNRHARSCLRRDPRKSSRWRNGDN